MRKSGHGGRAGPDNRAAGRPPGCRRRDQITKDYALIRAIPFARIKPFAIMTVRRYRTLSECVVIREVCARWHPVAQRRGKRGIGTETPGRPQEPRRRQARLVSESTRSTNWKV